MKLFCKDWPFMLVYICLWFGLLVVCKGYQRRGFFHVLHSNCFKDLKSTSIDVYSGSYWTTFPHSNTLLSRTRKLSGQGFGRDNGDHNNIEKKFGKKSDHILSIPSMEELANRNKMTDLKVISTMYDKAGQDEDSNNKKVFEDVVKFPTKFPLKVIGENSPEFENEVVSTVITALQEVRSKSDVPVATWESQIETKTKDTSGGKFISVTLKPYFRNSDELYLVYEVIKDIKGVKYCI